MVSGAPEAHTRALATPDAGHTGRAAHSRSSISCHGHNALPAVHQRLRAAVIVPWLLRNRLSQTEHGHLSLGVSSLGIAISASSNTGSCGSVSCPVRVCCHVSKHKVEKTRQVHLHSVDLPGQQSECLRCRLLALPLAGCPPPGTTY